MLCTVVNKVSIDGIEFDNVTMQDAVARIQQMVDTPGQAQYVCTANLDHLFMLDKDRAFRVIYQKADLILADGMPIVWLSRFCPGGRLRERVAGSDLFWELARLSEEKRVRLFFLGGAPGSAEKAAEEVRKRFPDVQICGTYCPSFELFETEAEQARIEDAIRCANPDVLLVGLGAPKQEKWIAAHKDRIGVPVSIGVGGTFEMAGGIVQRAPRWAQRVGAEWLFRMLQDPKRLWRRYIVGDLPFLMKLTSRICCDALHKATPPEKNLPVEEEKVIVTAPVLEEKVNGVAIAGLQGLPR